MKYDLSREQDVGLTQEITNLLNQPDIADSRDFKTEKQWKANIVAKLQPAFRKLKEAAALGVWTPLAPRNESEMAQGRLMVEYEQAQSRLWALQGFTPQQIEAKTHCIGIPTSEDIMLGDELKSRQFVPAGGGALEETVPGEYLSLETPEGDEGEGTDLEESRESYEEEREAIITAREIEKEAIITAREIERKKAEEARKAAEWQRLYGWSTRQRVTKI